jgi:pimeloyl-ACP methyl ester carboxylesterase
MPLIQLKNGKIVHIRDVPSDDHGRATTPFVCLHGLGSSQNFYDPLIPALRKTRRCVCMDTPGSARSPVPEPEQSIQSLSEDVISLLDTLGLEKVILVGHSLGGSTGCNVAAEFPERIEKLVLLGPVNPNATAANAQIWTDRLKIVEKGTIFKGPTNFEMEWSLLRIQFLRVQQRHQRRRSPGPSFAKCCFLRHRRAISRC